MVLYLLCSSELSRRTGVSPCSRDGIWKLNIPLSMLLSFTCLKIWNGNSWSANGFWGTLISDKPQWSGINLAHFWHHQEGVYGRRPQQFYFSGHGLPGKGLLLRKAHLPNLGAEAVQRPFALLGTGGLFQTHPNHHQSAAAESSDVDRPPSRKRCMCWTTRPSSPFFGGSLFFGLERWGTELRAYGQCLINDSTFQNG